MRLKLLPHLPEANGLRQCPAAIRHQIIAWTRDHPDLKCCMLSLDLNISRIQTPVSSSENKCLCLSLQGHLPFAVVGSLDEIKVGNKMVKARQYPWGTVQGEGC